MDQDLPGRSQALDIGSPQQIKDQQTARYRSQQTLKPSDLNNRHLQLLASTKFKRLESLNGLICLLMASTDYHRSTGQGSADLQDKGREIQVQVHGPVDLTSSKLNIENSNPIQNLTTCINTNVPIMTDDLILPASAPLICNIEEQDDLTEGAAPLPIVKLQTR